MTLDTLHALLDFLRETERLKDVLRSGHTSSGRPESTAEHSWRLCLMALAFADALSNVDTLKLLKLCVVHDLGEALHGDIPAIEQTAHPDKSTQERDDLLTLTAALDRALWDEYEAAASPEARAAKALDKLETILQHNRGSNPPDFDYAFNLGYGRCYTDAAPLFAAIRPIVDADTRSRIDAFDVRVFHRLAWTDELQLDAMFVRPGIERLADELRPVIHLNQIGTSSSLPQLLEHTRHAYTR